MSELTEAELEYQAQRVRYLRTRDDNRRLSLDLDDADKLIAAARKGMEAEWQKIETAPKDGTSILLFYPRGEMEGIIEGWWFSSPKEIDDGWETVIGFIGEPSHWMPLPEKKIVVWNEPLCLKEGFVANSVCRATEAEIIKAMKGNFPERDYTDERALDEFIAVHWAWREPSPQADEAHNAGEIIKDAEHMAHNLSLNRYGVDIGVSSFILKMKATIERQAAAIKTLEQSNDTWMEHCERQADEIDGWKHKLNLCSTDLDKAQAEISRLREAIEHAMRRLAASDDDGAVCEDDDWTITGWRSKRLREIRTELFTALSTTGGGK